ncbi:MAG: cell surface protein SprA [Candidatus Kapabacteria bacterium]|nr:cell surface protein SprA [Candidatus Kapabacteria bacterium]
MKPKKIVAYLGAIFILLSVRANAWLETDLSSIAYPQGRFFIYYLFGNFPYFPLIAQQMPMTKLDSMLLDSSLSPSKKKIIIDNYIDSLLKNPLPTGKPPLFKKTSYFNSSPFYNGKGHNQNLPAVFKSEIKMDSADSEKFVYDETLNGVSTGKDYQIDIDEYLARRAKAIRKRVWDSTLTYYDLKKALTGTDLARLLGQSTGMSIPIPPNPLVNIFGKPEINLNVSGEINLRLGVRFDSQNKGAVSAFGQSQTTPIFSQDIRVNVSGGIGDKLKLSTDWNTRRTIDFDNKFKIGFEGESDDIVKLVEVGNVSLPLTTTLIRGGQSLFGIRADFQFGPLFLKTLYSQKRGEKKVINAQGGVSKQQFGIHAYDFAKNHFFFDEVYKSIYKKYFSVSTPILPNTDSAKYNRIKEVNVWESETQQNQYGRSGDAVLYATLDPIVSGTRYPAALKQPADQTAGIVARGKFQLLDSTRYQYDPNLGTLTILNLRPDRTYGVSYRIEGKTNLPDDDLDIGDLATKQLDAKEVRILKLVYCPNMQPGFKVLWSRQMKNIYSINATNVSLSDTKIGLWYLRNGKDSSDVIEGAPDKLVSIFGVDKSTNGTGAPPADGQFDMIIPYFNAVTGEITFPSLEPFRQGLIDYFRDKVNNEGLADTYIYPDIYDTTYEIAILNTRKDRFVISGEVSGRATNRIALGGFNLAPGSVRVYLNGVPLREYEDFIVDYYAGSLTLRNPNATVPGANLKVEFEQNDIFNISTKTLAGIRADYSLYRGRKLNANLGMTFMMYDQSAVITRVRLGEEPVSNSMLGFDANLNWETQWLTKALDLLPFYSTKVASSLNVRAEWAMILPQPNKRLSDVSGDNNEPVVYIDDFEGSQRYIPLGLNPLQWQHSSQPMDSSIAPDDFTRSLFRGKMTWWQFFIPRVNITEVYPNKSVQIGQQRITPLEISFIADYRGIYNKNKDFIDALNPKYDSVKNDPYSKRPEIRPKIWGGMTRLLSSFTTNFDSENMEYIEIMMKVVDKGTENTRMFIDMGQISEDIIPNNLLNTEDGITAASPMPNGIIDPGEDVGIDAIADSLERHLPDSTHLGGYPYPLNLEKDPARDNYAFDFNKQDDTRLDADFINYNNFENNSTQSEAGQTPDTEILNKNNGQNVLLSNDYFTYEVNLDTLPQRNPQLVGGGSNQWYLYRIPIRKPSSRVGNPQFSNIQYVRVWFKGGFIRAQIADWRLVGAQWRRLSNFQSDVPNNDSVLQISFVNREENSKAPENYEMPPQVKPPLQPTNTSYDQIYLNEQSLAVSVRNLPEGEERMATRMYRPSMDIFYYKKLKFFIHGEILQGPVPRAYAFVRFGIDSSNYYEYRCPLINNINNRGWTSCEVDMSALASLKQKRDWNFTDNRFELIIDENASIIVRGNPTLTKVQFFGIGIYNPKNFHQPLTTTMWIDELRLLSPENSKDWAGIANIDLKLADLGNIHGVISNTQPNFHNLEERFGNRATSTNWSVTMDGNLEKFAPKSFTQMKIPVTYSHVEFMQTPQFIANDDVNLQMAVDSMYSRTLRSTKSVDSAATAASALKNSSQTLRVQDNWALTGIKLGIPTTFFLINETFNKTTFAYSYMQEFERSPIVAERFNWLWRASAQYTNQIPKVELDPLKWINSETPVIGVYSGWKLNLLPSNFTGELNFLRRRSTEQSRYLSIPSPIIREFSALRKAQFSWKISEGGLINPLVDYSVTTASSLVRHEFNLDGTQRTGAEIAKAMLFNSGKLIDFGDNTTHNQTISINFKPKLPNFGGLSNYFDIAGIFSNSYNWNNPMQPDTNYHDIAKSASYQNSIRLTNGFRLKSLADKWFGVADQRSFPGKVPSDTNYNVFHLIGRFFKTVFLDYDKIDFTINETTSSMNPGIIGGENTGLGNFWTRGLAFRPSENVLGPSFAYQMGLVSNPHGGFRTLTTSKFPFVEFETYPGLRPKNAVLQDNFNQMLTFDIKTSRPLWEGATLDMTWKTSLGFNRNQTVTTDSLGRPTFSNIVKLQSLNRTYISFPSMFGINVFSNNIENVVSHYNQYAKDPNFVNKFKDTLSKNRALRDSLSKFFRNDMETFSIFKGELGRILPSINWAIHWEGLEKWSIFKGFAKKISFEHVYTSQYQENVLDNDKGRTIQTQQLQFGFNPLIGLVFGFDEKKLKGVLTASIKYSTTSSYGITIANNTSINKTNTHDFSAQASYIMHGFEFALLGIKLKNDLEYSFQSSVKVNKQTNYDITDSASYKGPANGGRTVNGNTQIMVEPRVRYSIDKRLTASAFFRYEGTINEGAANPGFSTTQFGVDIRISISGGR